MRLIESVKGTVQMADGGTRPAYRNTYQGIENSADGTTFRTVEATQIEFATDTAAGRTRTWRKASVKQAASFTTPTS
jgi:hypothetical protein